MVQLLVTIKNFTSSIKSYDWLNKNDIFIVIKHGNQMRRTTTKWDDNTPIWDESFIITQVNNELELIIYDEDSWSTNEFIKSDKIKFSRKQTNYNICEVNIDITYVECVDVDTIKHNRNIINKMKDTNIELKKNNKYLNEQNKSLIDNIEVIKNILNNDLY